VHERGFRAGLAGGLEEVQRADGVGVEIIERDRGGAVMRGLGGGVDDDRGRDRLDEGEDARAVADVEFVVDEAGEFPARRDWFQRVSPWGPKKTARWLLSTPWTV
jgi:hypothetical protein